MCNCALRSTNIESADMKSRTALKSVFKPAGPKGNKDQNTILLLEMRYHGKRQIHSLHEEKCPKMMAST